VAPEGPRPVRIPRAPPGGTGAGGPVGGAEPAPSAVDRVGPPPGELGNRPGLRRARRLLLLYLLAVFAFFSAVVALFASSPYDAIRTDVPAYAVLFAVAAASAIGGYFLTVGRAPWSIAPEGSLLVVRERFGATRRYAIDGNLRVRVVSRSEGGWLSPEPTETVRVSSGRAPAREYVVGAGVVTDRPEIADAIVMR
jgi:hypothetical protein